MGMLFVEGFIFTWLADLVMKQPAAPGSEDVDRKSFTKEGLARKNRIKSYRKTVQNLSENCSK